jgi:hypothetical protein
VKAWVVVTYDYDSEEIHGVWTDELEAEAEAARRRLQLKRHDHRVVEAREADLRGTVVDDAIEARTVRETLTALGYGDDLRRVGVYETIRALHARAKR